MHLYAHLSQVSHKKVETQRKPWIYFLFLSHYRNVFYVYASTLGTEETSEADDVFNEKAELHVFREKVKTSHENEVRGGEEENRFFKSSLRKHHENNCCFLRRRLIMTQIAAIAVRRTPSTPTITAAPTSTRIYCSTRSFTQATRERICLRRICLNDAWRALVTSIIEETRCSTGKIKWKMR